MIDLDLRREKQRTAQRAIRARAREAGLCLACCRSAPAPGRKSCTRCLEMRGRRVPVTPSPAPPQPHTAVHMEHSDD